MRATNSATRLAATLIVIAAATCAARAADLPRAASGRPDAYAGLGYVVGEAPSGRYVDPIQVGRTLPRAVPLMPMPARYSVIGYGYTVVNGRRLLIDRATREIVEVLVDQ